MTNELCLRGDHDWAVWSASTGMSVSGKTFRCKRAECDAQKIELVWRGQDIPGGVEQVMRYVCEGAGRP